MCVRIAVEKHFATVVVSYMKAKMERIPPIKMHCIKLLGQSFMARDFDRQVAELQVRIAVLNRYTALGIPVTGPVG